MRNTVKGKNRWFFFSCGKRIFRGLKETSMGNATDRQTEICSCTITDMRKIEPLRGDTISKKINPEQNKGYIWANRITVRMIHEDGGHRLDASHVLEQNVVSVVFVAYQQMAVYWKGKHMKKGKTCRSEIQ